MNFPQGAVMRSSSEKNQETLDGLTSLKRHSVTESAASLQQNQQQHRYHVINKETDNVLNRSTSSRKGLLCSVSAELLHVQSSSVL